MFASWRGLAEAASAGPAPGSSERGSIPAARGAVNVSDGAHCVTFHSQKYSGRSLRDVSRLLLPKRFLGADDPEKFQRSIFCNLAYQQNTLSPSRSTVHYIDVTFFSEALVTGTLVNRRCPGSQFSGSVRVGRKYQTEPFKDFTSCKTFQFMRQSPKLV